MTFAETLAVTLSFVVVVASTVPAILGALHERKVRKAAEQEALRVQRVLDHVHLSLMRDLRSGRTFEIDGDRNRVVARPPYPHGRVKVYALDRVRVSTLAIISAARS